MGAYWEGLVADVGASPAHDLISQILQTEVEGRCLIDEEVAGFCSLLHDAAQNTTMNMITHSGDRPRPLHPDQRRRLADDPQPVAAGPRGAAALRVARCRAWPERRPET